MKKLNIQQRKCSACHPLATDTLPLINSFVDHTVFYVDGFMTFLFRTTNAKFWQKSGPVKMWSGTNIWQVGKGVGSNKCLPFRRGGPGVATPGFFCIFLIQDSAFWCILWLRKWTLSVFYQCTGKGRLLKEAAKWGPKAEIGVGFIGRGQQAPPARGLAVMYTRPNS